MPGMFKKALHRLVPGGERRAAIKEEKRKYSLTRKQRKDVAKKLSVVHIPKAKTQRKGRVLTERDHYYMAVAEARRARRRNRNIWYETLGKHPERNRQPSPELVVARQINLKRSVEARTKRQAEKAHRG